MKHALLASIILLTAACASGPYNDPPRYALPETRTTAARYLNQALAFSGRDVSEVAADEVRLTWNQRRQLTDKRWLLVPRELLFESVVTVSKPTKFNIWWEVEVGAVGGNVTFAFDDSEDAAKAEIAFRRLRQSMTEVEERAIARKYLDLLEGKDSFYVTRNGKPVREDGQREKNPDWTNPEAAAQTLRALTGEDLGNDPDIWRAYLNERYGI